MKRALFKLARWALISVGRILVQVIIKALKEAN
jgi:hypothetical protein